MDIWMMNKRIVAVLMMMVGLAGAARSNPASDDVPQFKTLDVRLPNNEVKAICRGSDGFLWIGTEAGLARYDGFEVVSYSLPMKHRGQSPYGYVDRIVEYPKGKLWVRTGNQYLVFDMEREAYAPSTDDCLSAMGFADRPICVFSDSRQRLWLAFFGGYVKCCDASGRVGDAELAAGGVTGHNVSAFGETAEGIIAVYDDGLIQCLDKESLKERWHIKIGSRGDDAVSFRLLTDRDDWLWLYGADWLGCYDPSHRQWLRQDRGNNVHAMCEDADGRIWIGREHGLDIYDKRSATTVTLLHDAADERSIPYNTVTALCCDADGTVWVGTGKNGIACYSPGIYKAVCLPVDDVNAVTASSDGTLWMGVGDGGLVRRGALESNQRRFTAADGLLGDNVVSLLAARDGRLWIGTFQGGLLCYDGHTFRHYAPAHQNVWALTEDAAGHIWLGTLGGGVQMLDPATDNLTTFDSQNTHLPIDHVNSLCSDKAGNVFIATMSGGIYIKRPGEAVKPLGKAGQMTYFTYQILSDRKGTVWIATQNGLYRYDAAHDSLTDVTPDSTQGPPVIYGLAEDADGRIWFSMQRELFAIGTDGRLSRYNGSDGLKIGTVNPRSLYAATDGRVMLGTLEGLNILDPQTLDMNTGATPRVLFPRLDILGRRQGVGDEPEGRMVLSQSLNSQRTLTLRHDQKTFTVYFASDNLIQPDKVRFRYRLEGFDHDSYECAPDVHWATYTSLPSGTYTLRVTAYSSDGMAGEEATIHIRILPPWWLSPWAWVFYTLFIIAVVTAFVLAVRRRERHKFQLRQMEDEARKAEELNLLKFRFFTNVSHELRTPLTLIIMPLENLLGEVSDERQHAQLSIIHKSARRLLMMVNQILDFRKMEMADMKLQLSEGDIVEFVHNISDTFTELQGDRGRVQLTFFSALPSQEMLFDEDKVQKIMFNLLSNAYKFTPESGRVDVAIELSKEKVDTLVIRVADNGIGISDDDKQHIFDRFYQASDSTTMRHAAGSGIGLNLVKEFVEMHGGNISVVDNVGGGSVFIVELPISHSNNSPSPKAESNNTSPSEEDGSGAAETGREATILVVDDNDDLVHFMTDIFSLYYQVVTASNGREAWEMIQARQPDIIVSDMMMPVMDGNELCRLVKGDASTRHIPFVMLTARHAEDSRIETLKAGADEYVTKPFNTEVLLLRLQKLLELSRRRGPIDPEVTAVEITSQDEILVADAIKFVEQNIEKEDLSVDDLSRALGMSRTNMYNKMFAVTGKKPKEFIRVIRMKRAAQLLRDSDLSISEIAYRVGLNPRIFSRHFKDEFGCLPSEYGRNIPD